MNVRIRNLLFLFAPKGTAALPVPHVYLYNVGSPNTSLPIFSFNELWRMLMNMAAQDSDPEAMSAAINYARRIKKLDILPIKVTSLDNITVYAGATALDLVRPRLEQIEMPFGMAMGVVSVPNDAVANEAMNLLRSIQPGRDMEGYVILGNQVQAGFYCSKHPGAKNWEAYQHERRVESNSISTQERQLAATQRNLRDARGKLGKMQSEVAELKSKAKDAQDYAAKLEALLAEHNIPLPGTTLAPEAKAGGTVDEEGDTDKQGSEVGTGAGLTDSVG